MAESSDLERALHVLIQASGSLFGVPRLDAVLPATIQLARGLLTADAYAIWRQHPSQGIWQIACAEGLSERFTKEAILTGRPAAASNAPFDAPILVEDLHGIPMLEARLAAYEAEGIRSFLAAPLRIHDRNSGTIVFYFREPHRFSTLESSIAAALGSLATAAIATAELHEEQHQRREEAEAARVRDAFMAEASTVLASSLDYETTLKTVAQLAVPKLADWCAVDIVKEDSTVERLAVAHVDPKKIQWARELQRRYPDNPSAPRGARHVIRTGQAEVVAEIGDDLLVATARDPEHLSTLREFGLLSYVCAPLIARGICLGAITFVTTADSGRRFGEAELAFAQELAGRAALAIDNARAYRQLEDAGRMKDEFLATLSHELRTPLNAIVGWARMLLTERLDAETVTRALQVIDRNARTQAQLIEDLLDVSRVVSGKLRLDLQPVMLSDTVNAAVETLRPGAQAKGVRLESMLDPRAGPVLADPQRIQQILWNLLSNAVKFTPKHGRVQLRLRRINSHVEISVSDTGQGIRPDFLPFVFEPFRQADSSTTRAVGGLGLGLAIVRHLVELHGGSVRADSPGENQGATFTLSLPLMVIHQDLREPVVTLTPEPALSVSSSLELNGLRVLVVDDDQDTRHLVRQLLQSAGAIVVSVGSAPEALTVLDTEACDVLVCDIELPGQDGYQLLSEIRRRPPAASGRIPAVALTAYSRVEDRTRALRAGFQQFVAKPADSAELLAVIATVADRARPQTP